MDSDNLISATNTVNSFKFIIKLYFLYTLAPFRERRKQRAWKWENGLVEGKYICDLFGK